MQSLQAVQEEKSNDRCFQEELQSRRQIIVKILNIAISQSQGSPQLQKMLLENGQHQDCERVSTHFSLKLRRSEQIKKNQILNSSLYLENPFKKVPEKRKKWFIFKEEILNENGLRIATINQCFYPFLIQHYHLAQLKLSLTELILDE
ncbi:unnamed protein product [Paramecium octaurelia]|uniref:Uncharacterized protein n=1 Tax=Paramecium octaurelia TaxID=43137 RepID=A0A8S1YRH7_PAROT|nr:unnamed protein product [Paramecium octaurelia]